MVKKADYVLIAALLIFACVFYFIVDFGKTSGQVVEIRKGTELAAVLQLNENGGLELRDADGILLNIISVENGEVKMIYASCPDQLCVGQGKISKTRESIICLPNFIVVIIGGNKNEYDAIVK